MSASREKKKRMEESASGAQEPKGLGKAAKITIGVVITAVVLAILIFFAMITGNFFQTHTTAATVHGHDLTPGMVNIYYNDAYRSNAQMLTYFVDPDQPLDEQAYMTEDYATWADYLVDVAVGSANAAYSIYDEATANGFTMSEEARTAIDQEMENLDAMAVMNGYPSGDALLSGSYGKGTTAKVYKEYLIVNQTAQEYAASIVEGLTYEQADLDAYYAEHSDDFDAVDYRMFAINAEKAEGEEEISAEALAAAEDAAKAAVEASTDEAAYLEQAAANNDVEDYEAEVATMMANRTISSLGETTKEWLTSADRKEGDVAYFGNGADTGFQVLYFIGTADTSYQLPNVRHILVSFPEGADEAAKAEAKEQAEAILAEFEAGDATEEAFAELATAKTEDQGSKENGGLYENVTKGSMVEPFDAWIYEEGRQVGDTGIVETQYGYHVMYFSGYGDTFQNYAVEQTLMNNDFEAWRTATVSPETYEVLSTKYVTTH